MLKKVSHEEERSNIATVTIADIDRTMKKYSDNLLYALEGVSSRLSQMESRTHQLETSVDDLKVTIGNYNGSTDGKLRHLENMLREVSFLRHFILFPLLYKCLLSSATNVILEKGFLNGRKNTYFYEFVTSFYFYSAMHCIDGVLSSKWRIATFLHV